MGRRHGEIAGRVPPHDLDAEAAVLSAAMLDAEARDAALTVLSPEHFYSSANGKVWGAVAALSTDGTPVDVVTVAGWLRVRGELDDVGGAKYLAQLVDSTPAVANVVAHAKSVWSKARRRAAIEAMHRLLAAGYGYDHDDEEFLVEVDTKITAVLSNTFEASGPRHIRDVLVETLQAINEAAEKGAGHDAIPTPVAELTRLYEGGFRPGDLVTIAARPGHGKSSLADQCAAVAATPRDIGLHGWVYEASLEMPGEQKGARMLADASGVPLSQLRTGLLTTQQWNEVTAGAARLTSLPVWIDDQPSTPVRVAATARKLARKAERAGSRLAMVIVDYLQILDLPQSDTRERAVAEASGAMKRLAKELRCPVLQLAQLNRGVDSLKEPRPNLGHLKESGAIEADSDSVIFVYRPEQYDQFKDDPEMAGVAELIVAKQRNGSTGIVRCKWDGPRTRFLDADGGDERFDGGGRGEWSDFDRTAQEYGL